MNVPHQDESDSLLAAKRVAAPASTWVRKAVAGTVLVAGCAVAAVAYAQAGASANTHAALGAGAPHRLSPRQRAMRHYVASKRRYRVEGERSTLGQTTAVAEAAEFDSMTPDEQFEVIGDGGVDGSDFHHMNVYHVYPGIEGCETTCEGEGVTKAMCDSMFFCEYDAGKCWSGVGNFPCPANEQELYDIWDAHYDDYETGLHHDLEAFPDYVYPGTVGCETTCEHVETSKAQCDSMFYCEWEEERCMGVKHHFRGNFHQTLSVGSLLLIQHQLTAWTLRAAVRQNVGDWPRCSRCHLCQVPQVLKATLRRYGNTCLQREEIFNTRRSHSTGQNRQRRCCTKSLRMK